MEFERNDYGFPVMWAGELAGSPPSSGTVDDQGAPEDERDDENEASEEFEDNELIREPVVPPKAR